MVITLDKTFVPGDVVFLKSGGPKMTVESVGTQDGELYARCVFFDKNVSKRISYVPAVLSKIDDDNAVWEKVAKRCLVY
jgi:uncharacterized protein YodC (DUF2158 family)